MSRIELMNNENQVIQSVDYTATSTQSKKRKPCWPPEVFPNPYVPPPSSSPYEYDDEKEQPSSPSQQQQQPMPVASSNDVFNVPSPFDVQPLDDHVSELNAYRRFYYKRKHKQDIISMKDLHNDSSDDEEGDYIGEDDSEDEYEIEQQRKETLRQEVETFHAQYNYNMDKIRKKRETHWKRMDIRKKWCFICDYKFKTKSEDRFHDLESLQTYWMKNIGRMKLKWIIGAIQDKFLTDFAIHLPKRSIDPYTNHIKPHHWWSPISIYEHFIEHDPIPYTYSTMRLKSSMKLLRDCEDAMRRKDLATGMMIIDGNLFKQRKQLIEEIRMFQSFLDKTNESTSTSSSMMAAMNTASAKQ